MADNVMIYNIICKNVARRHGKVATFMPSRVCRQREAACIVIRACGKTTRISFTTRTLGADSDMCRWYTGGLLQHAPALMAFCAPTTNSYKRLVPGYEAPVNLAMSQRNRSAAARIPMYSDSPNARASSFAVQTRRQMRISLSRPC